MKLKHNITNIFGLLLVFALCFAVDALAQQELSAEEKRFDSDGNGQLSEEEKEAMIEAIAREVFFGQQGPPPDRRDGRRGRRRGPRRPEALVSRFDTDKDGKLNATERKAAREYRATRDADGSSRPSGQSTPSTTIKADLEASAAAKPSGKQGLYNAKTLRTLYLRFHDADWYEQLGAFYRTDVDVPADLIVDGKVYKSVGVSFRGSSSYFTLGDAEKKSFNIAVDFTDDRQRLLGYKTLNLLNGHSDASFLREVLYSRIARNYIPAPKANFVKLFINGESWGIYINSQQFNKDFLDEWFGTKKGVRFKVPPGNLSGLVYRGESPKDYQEAYQLKTNRSEAPDAWRDLINLCKTLEKTPDDQLEAELSAIFNIDRALWFLALENVFIDSDGYFSRASDYAIYQDTNGRFHLLPHDSNETFRFAGGRGGPNTWVADGRMLSPLGQADDATRPVIRRLFAVPHLRARYLAHLRTIAREWLDWDILKPMLMEYHSLIDPEVKADDKKLYSYEAFSASYSDGGNAPSREVLQGSRQRRSAPSFKQFVEQRREYLLSHAEIDKPIPTIESVSKPKKPLANQPVQISATIGEKVGVEAVFLYYAVGRLSPFEGVRMSKNGDENEYVGAIPAFPAGKKVRYYVEARSLESHGTTAFFPAKTEFEPLTYRVGAPIARSSPVVINELMADNTASYTDPQGDHDDWIELYNHGENEVNLSGMYLSDNPKNPRKWQFPKNTKIRAGGYLIVWADEDGSDQPGLHANFKLSKSGEELMLVDTDANGNRVLSSVKFDKQRKDVAFGRVPNGTGAFKTLKMTPGEQNN